VGATPNNPQANVSPVIVRNVRPPPPPPPPHHHPPPPPPARRATDLIQTNGATGARREYSRRRNVTKRQNRDATLAHTPDLAAKRRSRAADGDSTSTTVGAWHGTVRWDRGSWLGATTSHQRHRTRHHNVQLGALLQQDANEAAKGPPLLLLSLLLSLLPLRKRERRSSWSEGVGWLHPKSLHMQSNGQEQEQVHIV